MDSFVGKLCSTCAYSTPERKELASPSISDQQFSAVLAPSVDTWLICNFDSI